MGDLRLPKKEENRKKDEKPGKIKMVDTKLGGQKREGGSKEREGNLPPVAAREAASRLPHRTPILEMTAVNAF